MVFKSLSGQYNEWAEDFDQFGDRWPRTIKVAHRLYYMAAGACLAWLMAHWYVEYEGGVWPPHTLLWHVIDWVSEIGGIAGVVSLILTVKKLWKKDKV